MDAKRSGDTGAESGRNRCARTSGRPDGRALRAGIGGKEMSIPAVATPQERAPKPAVFEPAPRRGRWRRIVLWVVVTVVLTGLAAWGGVRLYSVLTASHAAVVPTTLVRRRDVTITVSARGRLQGGNSEM